MSGTMYYDNIRLDNIRSWLVRSLTWTTSTQQCVWRGPRAFLLYFIHIFLVIPLEDVHPRIIRYPSQSYPYCRYAQSVENIQPEGMLERSETLVVHSHDIGRYDGMITWWPYTCPQIPWKSSVLNFGIYEASHTTIRLSCILPFASWNISPLYISVAYFVSLWYERVVVALRHTYYLYWVRSTRRLATALVTSLPSSLFGFMNSWAFFNLATNFLCCYMKGQ